MITKKQVIEKILKYIPLEKDLDAYSKDDKATLHPDILQAAQEASQLIVQYNEGLFYSSKYEERIIAEKVQQYDLQKLQSAFVERAPQLDPPGEVSSYGFC